MRSTHQHLMSIAALVIFCLLAAGSMDSNSNDSKNKPVTMTQAADAAAADPAHLGITLSCTEAGHPENGAYLFYGDSFKDWISLTQGNIWQVSYLSGGLGGGGHAYDELKANTGANRTYDFSAGRELEFESNFDTADHITLERETLEVVSESIVIGQKIYGHYDCKSMSPSDAASKI